MNITINKEEYKLTQIILSKPRFTLSEILEEVDKKEIKIEPQQVKGKLKHLRDTGLITEYPSHYELSSLWR